MKQTKSSEGLYIIVPRQERQMDDKKNRAWAEINTDNLKYNLRELNKVIPENGQIMAVVKADAYGHGALEISRILSAEGVQAFAVATLKEGIQLRQGGIKGEILILGMTDTKCASTLKKWNLTQTIIDFNYAKKLQEENVNVKVHVKIDTGMGRLGEPYNQRENILKIFQFTNLSITGTYTHLCAADSFEPYDVAFTYRQIKRFYSVIDKLRCSGISLGKIHIQSSYGLLNYPELHCDYARIGIALYGALSRENEILKTKIALRPVLSLKSKVALIKDLNEGDTVGYGHHFIAKKQTRIAIVSIGYADGIPRNLSCEKGYVLLHGQKVPIIGNICMDQLIVNITEIQNNVVCGDVVTLIGQDGNENISPEMFANNTGTITNEILSRIGDRIEKIYN